ncbi:MAG: 1,2-phenylacetyl-CoA epoxidase subunit PaaD [Chloroflexota bacterium]
MVTNVGTRAPSVADVRAALRDVADPEIPVVSVMDLGMVDRVEVAEGRVSVDLLPTFIGCPALEMIETAVTDRLAAFGLPTEVTFTTRVPWTSDRISERGRERLRAAGIAPPADPSDVRCAWCGSVRVVMDSAFGPTQCRSLFYCRDCRQPFEALKPV